MEWWQIAALMLLGAALAGGLVVLRGRVSMINGASDARVAVATAAAMTPARVAQLEAELATVRTEWAAVQKQLEAYIEAATDIEETTERTRRRAAARESKAKNAEAPADPRAAAYRRARELGYLS